MKISRYTPAIVLLVLMVTVSLNSNAKGSSFGISRILNQVANEFPLTEGYVVALVDGELILDLKQGEPVESGDRLKLFWFGEELKHPVSGNSLGYMETNFGEVEILEVRKNFTRAKPLGTKIKV